MFRTAATYGPPIDGERSTITTLCPVFALDIANTGHKVVMVERSPSIGGHMSQLSETFPTLDCSQCILTPRMVEVAQHPNITLYTYAEVESVEGFIGNFKVKDPQKSKEP